MDAEQRTLLQIGADEIFTTLMGDARRTAPSFHRRERPGGEQLNICIWLGSTNLTDVRPLRFRS